MHSMRILHTLKPFREGFCRNNVQDIAITLVAFYSENIPDGNASIVNGNLANQ